MWKLNVFYFDLAVESPLFNLVLLQERCRGSFLSAVRAQRNVSVGWLRQFNFLTVVTKMFALFVVFSLWGLQFWGLQFSFLTLLLLMISFICCYLARQRMSHTRFA